MADFMKFSQASLVVCVFGLFIVWTRATPMETFYLTDFCGESFSLKHYNLKAFILKVTRNKTYSPNMDCDMKVFAPTNQRLMFLFTEINMYDCQDFADVYEYRIDHYNGLDPEICDTLPSGALVTTWSHGLIGFTSNGHGGGQGFTAVITAFQTDTCSSTEFRCDNGRCIDVGLNCSGYNNCGDDSNNVNCRDNSVQIIFQVIYSVVSVICFVGVILICRRRNSLFHNNRIWDCDCNCPRCPRCPNLPRCPDMSLPWLFRRSQPSGSGSSGTITTSSTQTSRESNLPPDEESVGTPFPHSAPSTSTPSPPVHRSLGSQRPGTYSDPPPAYDEVQPPPYEEAIKKL